ncbi:unnamed protein product [Allacma fusca]|uniref:Ion transport domain-containing protein n=1 Tax=Allacma fusca TaxID=39272 RepID=A0A8J2KV30_9HEXA|nr:unnamed protein product [Allacma fusca]
MVYRSDNCAINLKAEKSWIVGMLAIVAAMGTGELNAQDHLEKVASGPFSLQEFIRVFCIILFVIIIVTLYFNLLIGYAVSDIQILKTKAETLQLYNKLSTMHTIESFLVSRYGRFLVAIYSKINCRQRKSHAEVNYMDDIYVLPLSQFHRNDGMETYTFDKFPPQQLKLFKKIAFNNILKRKKEKALLRNRINKFLK